MAPKNKKKTGFYFFMKEQQESYAQRGQTIKMADMPALVHHIWKDMSIAEKEPYEKMAKEYKADPSLVGKLASDGTKIEDNIREELEKERRRKQMIQDVKSFLNAECCSEETFKRVTAKKTFFILSFNILCRTEEEYVPIEVGIVKYSIEIGIIDEFNRIIYPGTIPTGYAGEAKQLSEDKHQIPVFDNANKVAAHIVYKEILAFLEVKNGEEMPPVFVQDSDMDMVKSCLNWLSKRARERKCGYQKFNVWNVTYLLMELRDGIGHTFPAYYSAQQLLKKTCFDYHPNSRCSFHEEVDVAFCALAYSKRTCYLISDAVCELFDITLTEQHIPPKASEDKEYEVTLPVFTRKEALLSHIIERDQSSLSIPEANTNFDGFLQSQDIRVHSRSDVSEEEALRQPKTYSVAQEMADLNLNITSAQAPGIGIGRGRRIIH